VQVKSLNLSYTFGKHGLQNLNMAFKYWEGKFKIHSESANIVPIQEMEISTVFFFRADRRLLYVEKKIHMETETWRRRNPCMPYLWDVNHSNNEQISVMSCSLLEIPHPHNQNLCSMPGQVMSYCKLKICMCC